MDNSIEPVITLNYSPESQGNTVGNKSSLKAKNMGDDGDLNSNPQSVSVSPMLYEVNFRDLSDREIIYFDSQPCLESDCEDFASVNGDFTPTLGSTPVHPSSSIETPEPEESLYNVSKVNPIPPESSPTSDINKQVKQLFELFSETLSDELSPTDAKSKLQESEKAKPLNLYLPSKRSKSSPYKSLAISCWRTETTVDTRSGEDKPSCCAGCCLPNFVRRLSFKHRKGRLTDPR
ncbi:hypothetical protein K2173_003315 [Erythroxylum novogranatense]|uniref:Uncharacterized protein n=1 Tax=Erythroxylum novogranatense TaxID=1862640 RepID=A0AAV8SXG4_9ROSI|nr:hypothetical protein K2173_003315 [Erythroxylum novogranatense]